MLLVYCTVIKILKKKKLNCLSLLIAKNILTNRLALSQADKF